MPMLYLLDNASTSHSVSLVVYLVISQVKFIYSNIEVLLAFNTQESGL